MDTNRSGLPLTEGDPPNDNVHPRFYVVSKRKFTILFLFTIGLFYLYWFYKNWALFRVNTIHSSEARKTIWPLMRAIFAIVFVFSLFRKIKEYGIEKSKVRAWLDVPHAGLVIVLILIFEGMDNLLGKFIDSQLSGVLSLLVIIPLLYTFLAAQEMINLACNDPSGAGNAKLTTANYAWIVIGAILWCLMLMALAFPDQG